MAITARWMSQRRTTWATDLPRAAPISPRTGSEKMSFWPSANGPQDSRDAVLAHELLVGGRLVEGCVSIRLRPRRACRRPAARRRRARRPVRPRPRGQPGRAQTTASRQSAAGAAGDSAHRRLHRLPCDGRQHARRLPDGQRARARCMRRCSTAVSSLPTPPASPSWDPAAQQFFADWEKAAKDLVAALRSEAGRNPHDRALSDLVGELSTRSGPFRKSWAAHNVRYHPTGRKRAAPSDPRRPRRRVRGHGAGRGPRPARGCLQRRAGQPLGRGPRSPRKLTATPEHIEAREPRST